MKGSFLFLGTGASAGVPLIGCKCPVCLSPSPHNRRFRPSGLLQVAGKSLLIDIGPDFRSQALRFHVDHVDGLLLTHTHYDHIAGIDEVRIFNVRQKRPLPCLLSKESYEELKKRYYYFFDEKEASAKLQCILFEGAQGEAQIEGISFSYYCFKQAGMKVAGFRIGSFAYISDIQEYDELIFPFLKGVKTLVVSALRPEPSPFHLSFNEAAAFSQRIGAQETWITHIGHFIDHDALNASLPSGVQAAYDGLKLEF